MKKTPAFLIYPKDFLAEIAFMDNAEVGIYIKLLCIQYQELGFIKSDLFNYMVPAESILRQYFTKEDLGYFNPRLQSQIDDANRKSITLSLNSSKRWSKSIQMDSKCIPNAFQMDSNAPRKVFIPPTLDEVTEYCNSRRNTVAPLKFYNFYQSKGWMVGKNKMKDWQAAVRNWEVMGRNSNKTLESARRLQEKWRIEDAEKNI